MTEGVCLERAQESDAPGIAAVAAAGLSPAWSVEGFEAELRRPDGRGFVARDASGTVRGYGIARLLADEVEILSLVVDGALRRRGLGRRLLEALLVAGARSGAQVAHLEVRVGAAAARALYAAAGFGEIGRRPRYYADGEDAMLLRRDDPGAAPVA